MALVRVIRWRKPATEDTEAIDRVVALDEQGTQIEQLSGPYVDVYGNVMRDATETTTFLHGDERYGVSATVKRESW